MFSASFSCFLQVVKERQKIAVRIEVFSHDFCALVQLHGPLTRTGRLSLTSVIAGDEGVPEVGHEELRIVKEGHL